MGLAKGKSTDFLCWEEGRCELTLSDDRADARKRED